MRDPRWERAGVGRLGDVPPPLPGDAAAGGGGVAGGDPAPTGTEMRPARAGARRRWLWARGCVWQAPTHVAYWGPEDAGEGGGSSPFWSPSLFPGHFAPELTVSSSWKRRSPSSLPRVPPTFLRRKNGAFGGSCVVIKPTPWAAPAHPSLGAFQEPSCFRIWTTRTRI
uniref:Uncharacterized protein n=1 Tax=Rousettus aegyptiacus TaxID=9407 RepID=A0A7J8IM38_ROUAE|nr:hypothetical protein HJG63_010794 [Rousettus aegyptiacus]